MKKQDHWNQFLQNCNSFQTTEELEQFFNLVLTPAEFEKIAARYQILSELIHSQKTHRELAKELDVSIFNITRGANQLKKISESEKQLIKKPKSCE